MDRIQYRAGGGEVPHEEYLKTHAALVLREAWIIDGFGSVASAWERFAAADTLIYVDLPLLTHGRWVTKRLVKGFFVTPEGWPENSPMWSSTLDSYRLRSPAQIHSFLEAVEKEHRGRPGAAQ